MSKLLIISAPSGAGKTTLCHRLLRDFPELVLSISSTTRAPRGQEKHAREYHFLTREKFETEIQAGRFAEWALVHGNYYGTSKDVIEETFAQGKSVLLDIDVQGAASLRKSYPEASYLVFVSPPSIEILEQRLRGRGTDSEETIQKRLKNARDELSRSPEFDRTIINDHLEKAYKELHTLTEQLLRKSHG
jgi:guanylate kinase